MDCGWIEAEWPAPPPVRALATTRRLFGVSRPPYDRCNLGARGDDDPAAVAANRQELIDALRLPSHPVWLHQVHGRHVVRAVEPAPEPVPVEHEPEADAAVTDRVGTVLAVLSADCLPVVFAVDDGSAVAAAHAGWRGLAAGVLEAALASLTVTPERVLAWLGPAIGPGAYEVGTEVRAAFVDPDPDAAVAFSAGRPGRWQCNLYALARLRLHRAGVDRVFGGDLCTYGDASRFYSYRRDGARSGRQATLIWLRRSP